MMGQTRCNVRHATKDEGCNSANRGNSKAAAPVREKSLLLSVRAAQGTGDLAKKAERVLPPTAGIVDTNDMKSLVAGKERSILVLFSPFADRNSVPINPVRERRGGRHTGTNFDKMIITNSVIYTEGTAGDKRLFELGTEAGILTHPIDGVSDRIVP